MVTLTSPDAGQTEWRYDVAGKLGAKETAQLRAQKKLINYTYDVNRLTTIDYPDSVGVTYQYGAKRSDLTDVEKAKNLKSGVPNVDPTFHPYNKPTKPNP
jgi:YD repeat-containing protein